ncbi:MAG: hypothetical protein ACREEV_14615, partial [Dongiaceae bacterium]
MLSEIARRRVNAKLSLHANHSFTTAGYPCAQIDLHPGSPSMIKFRSDRPCAALILTATILAGMALASCTTGAGPASRPSAQLGVAETASYSRIDAALRTLLAEPSAELQDLRPITLRVLKAY